MTTQSLLCSEALACAPLTARSKPPLLYIHACRTRSRFHSRLLCSANKRSKEATPSRAPRTPPSRGQPDSRQDDGQEKQFRVFDLSLYAAPFSAPWGGKEAALGMVAWAASFLGVGLAFIPLSRGLAGPEGLAGMSQENKAIFVLVNQLLETAVGLAVVNAAVSRFRPLAPDFFKISFKNPFGKPDGWAAWGLLGVLLSPVAVFATAALCEVVGISDDPAARGTADAVTQLLRMDPITFASLFGTTAVLAPVLEETVFRGFLLPSLARVMPTPLAVVASAVAFGLVHFSPRDTPQLTALGLLMGFTYVRTRNLLTPMLIHGTWNGAVLCILYYLTSQGIDVAQMLHGPGGGV